MSSRRVPLVASVTVILVLVAGLVPAPASAQDERVLRWDYEVSVPDPSSGRIDVTLRFENVEDVVDKIGLFTERHQHPLSDVESERSRLRPMDGGVELVVENDVESVSFTVDVNRPASRDGQYNAYLGEDWGIFKAEAFALGFQYTHVQGTPFRWESAIDFDLPAGWNAEMPLPVGDDGRFTLSEGAVLPRGFIAVGPFETVTSEAAGKTFRYAQLGEPLAYAEDTFPYLERATPYYERVYGDATDDVILAVSAPAPMFRGGLGGVDSFFVHDESDLRTFAHEYAHAWQSFNTVTEPGRASVWIVEGDADYHGVLSLFISNHWSLAEVNDFLEDYHAERGETPYRDTTLPEASYATGLEDVAYHKGALVLHALDREIRDGTNGEKGIADVMQAVNRERDQRVTDGSDEDRERRLSPVTNADFLDVIERATDWDASAFFERYVNGTAYPPFKAVTMDENIALTRMVITPPNPREGETMTVDVIVENRGLSDATKRVPLILNGELVDARNASVRKGASTNATFTFPAPGPGEHQLRSYYLEEWFEVLEPARFEIERTRLLPSSPAVGESAELLVYVRNAGDVREEARVRAEKADGASLGDRAVSVGGNATRAVSFTVSFDAPGTHTLSVRLLPSDDVHELTVDVQDADASGSTRSPDFESPTGGSGDGRTIEDVVNEVPAVGVTAGLLAAFAAAGLTRRRRRG